MIESLICHPTQPAFLIEYLGVQRRVEVGRVVALFSLVALGYVVT